MNKMLFFLGFMLMGLCANASSFTLDYEANVVFPAGYHIGDYVEFVKVSPLNAGASGNYEISISYVRNGAAAAATHLASISHYNPGIWREVGRINSNGYVDLGHSFTVDCNTEYANPRFRVRAVAILGDVTQPITVSIKIRSINMNGDYIVLNSSGNDLTVNNFLPMTNDWSLYVGNPFSPNGASIAIKAIENGNVGIGTSTPVDKLSVNGRIRSKEVKVEIANWPDYVFAKNYDLPSLNATEKAIKENGHLPGIPSAAEVKRNGIDLGEMNAKLLQKIEELTLYLIEKDKEVKYLTEEVKKNNQLEIRVQQLERKVSKSHLKIN